MGSERQDLKPRMYAEVGRTVNPFVGCRFGCIYCIPSFQRQKKRAKCESCRRYAPHPHLERLHRLHSRTPMLMMVPSCGDWAFIDEDSGARIIAEMRSNPTNTYLCQSKNPDTFMRFVWPENVILGTTMETDMYPNEMISFAPLPHERLNSLLHINHRRRSITVEPILKFDFKTFVQAIEAVCPEVVWVGYDNHDCHLPEPSLADTQKLIDRLKADELNVHLKTIRKAWWEDSP